ncbi:efflux RND transporter periplasmic adaptor subunit [Uliginosibacterium gangwonense]|uniref:efflux RND transporter periplasmic adaptor subunit n=1 Tax=Uliginosibacterium gangwonense TaxID=392736 RepID=UPI0003623CB7|nr:efflux RND transporter periplasmic adaptor subunit [Uliginosibacterium gangwonense]
MNILKRKILIASALAMLTGAAVLITHQQPVQAGEPVAAPAKAVLSVSTVLPGTMQWPLQINANGTLIAWQEAIVGAETGGLRITTLHADVGERVKRGQLLAELAQESVLADVRRYEASLASARASLAQAKANADRARTVRGSGALSEQTINEYLITEQTAQAAVDLADAQLASEKVILKQTRIVAPDDGVISSRSAVLGQVVSSGTELYRMVRQNRLEWRAEVDAKQLGMVQTGQLAEIDLPGGKRLNGMVRVAAPTLSTSTSRAYVYVSLPQDDKANAGMFSSGRIAVGMQFALTIPESALVMRDGHSYVFEVGAGNKVVRRTVGTGRHHDGLVEITTGLNTTAHVVKSGGAFLADGDLVNVSTGKEKS